MSRRLMLLIVLLVAALAALGSTSAGAVVRVGIQDQDYGDFTTPLFTQIGWKKVRYVVRYDVAYSRTDRTYLDRYLAEAKARGLEVLMTFNSKPSWRCPRRPCRAPSVASYRRAFRAFRKRWPDVRVFAPWNEANHRSQPTFRKPKQAAAYFNVVRKYCRGCTIVAADVIDERNMVSWLRVFKRSARGERIWGLHNYRDTNPRRGQLLGGTRRLLRAVRGPVWLTETGGIVSFKLPGGKTLFRKSEARASRALARMFRLAKRYRRRIARVYIYDWQQPITANRFDAGLLRRDGTARPGYRTVRRTLGGAIFRP